jgi:hypothetical protein
VERGQLGRSRTTLRRAALIVIYHLIIQEKTVALLLTVFCFFVNPLVVVR